MAACLSDYTFDLLTLQSWWRGEHEVEEQRFNGHTLRHAIILPSEDFEVDPEAWVVP